MRTHPRRVLAELWRLYRHNPAIGAQCDGPGYNADTVSVVSATGGVADDAHEGFGDERRVKQVLVNLLTNAVKFTPGGGSIDVIARRHDDSVVVAVRDTGIGISAEDQAKVFDDFKQVGDASLAQEGPGVGLALAKRFLELHDGDIWVESAPGHGATFSFRLPLPADGQPGLS